MINKIISKIAKDKLLHFTCSLILVFVSAGVCNLFKLDKTITFIISFVLVLIIGIIKEIIDSKRGGKFDFKDLIADFTGIILGIGLLYFIYL